MQYFDITSATELIRLTKADLATKLTTPADGAVGQTIVKTATGVAWADFPDSGGMPTGLIVLWSGAANAIPSGFSLCDGTNGTPNLVNRFIVGGTEPGATGSIGKTEVGDQIQYYTLCYIMKT